ncbi:hypothetical protein EXU48_10060 [Occultella glacieicola]|uniref:Uncharacterized protein n=1 Tax=Occultella glacieicola TaxID=2518684 RepID=A0ABY2E5K9_9MICO|nr:hypothetical protein [Occultella glacieicola]TDE95093.1 hypothetical protein EXU48_10060 [Occultella glacieicola]
MSIFGQAPDGDADETKPMLDSIVPGSEADKQLREAMETLREQATDDETRRLFTDIIEGRRSARDLVESPGFAAMAEEGVRQYQEQVAAMTDEERAELERQAAATDLDAPAGESGSRDHLP